MQTQALLFVDQVNSTRLLSEIGDQAMVTVRRRLQAIMGDAVAQHGGRIFGDMGDGVAAVFDSATEAARAALEMQAHADASGTVDDPSIDIRVGVHHGPVVSNGEGFIGMSVHLAARLCDAAPSGHVAASATFCEALDAASMDDVRITPYERRLMKGIADPVDVSLLTDPSRAEPVVKASAVERRWQIPSTPWLSERSGPRLMVGREEEQIRLDDACRASSDRVHLTLISGEAGIGKSTLLHSCGSQFAEQGHLCVIGRADASQPSPYREFIEALAHVVPHLPDAVIADHIVRHGHLLARLIPGLDQRVPALAADDSKSGEEPDRFRLFEAFADLLRSVTAHQPTVILIEDLHWSAEPSLALLQHLTRSVQMPSLLLIASFRTNEEVEGSSLATLLDRVGTDTNVNRIRLGPLRPADVQEMVADLPFSDVANQLHAKTSGSPLFLTEMIRSFDESGQPARGLDGSLLVPDTVQELAIGRVDRLGPAHRAVLADAALLGAAFSLSDVERLAPSHIDVLATLEEAEQAGVVLAHPVDDESFVFGHAVIREALYQRISAPRRRRRHRAAADAMLASGDDRVATQATEILRHIELSDGERPPELIAELASSAAEHSMLRLDLDGAVRHRRTAVDALQRCSDQSSRSKGELIEAMLALGSAETSAGKNRGRKTFVDAATAARQIGRWDLFCVAAVSYGGQMKENQAILDVSEPRGLVTEALQHEPEANAMRARLLTALATWERQYVPYEQRRALVDEAIDIARSLDDRSTLAMVLAETHRALHGPNTTIEALEASHELEHLAAELGDDLLAMQSLNLRIHAEFELGDWEQLEQRAERLEQLADRIGTIEGKRVSLLWRSTVATLRGDAIGRQAALDELNRLIAAFPPNARSIMLGASSMMLPLFQGHAGLLYEFGKDFSPPFIRALLAAESGQTDLAVEHIEEGGGPARTALDQNYMFFLDAVAMTRTALRTGDAVQAEEIYELLLPYRSRNARMGLVAFLGAVEHHLGTLAAVLGRNGDAGEHFAAALERHRQMEARPWVALTLAEFAAVTESRTDRERMVIESESIANDLDLMMVKEMLGRVDRGGR